MDSEIKNCTALDELFDLWRKKEGHEFFCIDGFIDKDTFEQQEKRVLFIAKESNVSKGKKDDVFWLQSVANGADHKILSRRISIMTNAYFENKFDDTDKNRDNLKKIAYMNINKHGGGSRTNAKELQAYATDYKEYIKREIEIIDPRLIVCCGKLVYEIITNILEQANISPDPEIIEVYHPSFFFISDKKYLERFHNALSDKKLLT